MNIKVFLLSFFLLPFLKWLHIICECISCFLIVYFWCNKQFQVVVLSCLKHLVLIIYKKNQLYQFSSVKNLLNQLLIYILIVKSLPKNDDLQLTRVYTIISYPIFDFINITNTHKMILLLFFISINFIMYSLHTTYLWPWL